MGSVQGVTRKKIVESSRVFPFLTFVFIVVCVGLLSVVNLFVASAATANLHDSQTYRADVNEGLGGVAVSCQIPTGDHFLNVNGMVRFFKTFTPSGSTSGTPVVVSFHGATGLALSQQNTSSFNSVATQEKFIVVYPQAVGVPPKTVWDATSVGKDADFVESLLNHLHKSGCGSPATTSMNGFSNGAMLVSRLLCSAKISTKITGVALVGGALSPEPGCAVTPDKHVLVIHGTRDSVVPYNGTITPTLQKLGLIPEAPARDRTAMALQWAQVKDCPSPGWGIWGQVVEVDYSCFRSITKSVVYPNTDHVWNGPGTNTSELIWATLRPGKPCVVTPPSPPNPALEKAIADRARTDVVFRTQLGRTIVENLPCDQNFRTKFENSLKSEVNRNPNGETAKKLRFLISDEIRVEPNGITAQKMREAFNK